MNLFRRALTGSFALAAVAAPQLGPLVSSSGEARAAVAPTTRSAPTNDPELSALIVGSLRRFAANVKDPTDLDEQIAKALRNVKNARKRAADIVAHIDALPAKKRAAAFGDHAALARKGGTLAQLATTTAVQRVSKLGNMVARTRTRTTVLPPEQVVDNEYRIVHTGIRATSSSDGDADGDELALFTSVVRESGNAFAIRTHESPRCEGIAKGAPCKATDEVWKGAPASFMLVSTLLEDDGDAANALADVELLMGLTATFAGTVNDYYALDRFQTALDYNLGILALSNPARWSVGAAVATPLYAHTGESAVEDLFANESKTIEGIPWKLRHSMATDGGEYSVYYDLPSITPAMNLVEIRIRKIESLDPIDEKGQADLIVSVAIEDYATSRTLPKNHDSTVLDWRIKRSVLPGKAKITVKVTDVSPGPELSFNGWTACGGDFEPNCPDDYRTLDLRAGEKGRTLTFWYVPKTGKLSGQLTGSAGQWLTVKGDGKPRARIELEVVAR